LHPRLVSHDPVRGAVWEQWNVDEKEGMAQVLLYDQLIGDDPIAFAIFDPKGLQIVAGDGGKLYDGAIQHEYNTRGNLWED
jgi:hypothetical protein